MESHWDSCKDISIKGIIVVLHVKKQGLFIAQVKVIFKLIVELNWQI